MIKRGSLIVFEGCDRSGKTTQCQKIKQWFQDNSIKSHFMRFPERSSKIGGLISKYLECNTELEDHAVHLLFSANRWEMVSSMRSILDEGTHLVIDRYAFSGTAFSAAKTNMDLKWCQQSDSGLPKPDLVIFLDLEPKVAQTRGQYGEERYENLEFQDKVRENYLKLKDDTWKIVDANRTHEEIHTEICQLITNQITAACKDLEKLWV